MATGNKKLERGYVQILTGDGKGKTTAALGMALRAVGHNLKVFMIMFMKGNVEYGELETARRLAPFLEIREMGRETFVSKENPEAIDIEWARDGLRLAMKILEEGKHDMLILDEVNVAVDFGLIPVEDVLRVIRAKPDHVELVLTGRYAHADLIASADLVTEMTCVKHYYQHGVEARVGIER
ncbi:MAG TPA: cob(I)yrinic acid a,c-diamide adenosyltransferase [Myxococcota bacterium]|nr:cob(I)yrinic acid a,c-diamide adenosyltransferase [Myxococcota bacterium]HRY93977.1 cob(I)yrinic acid a,c-diamide adenosyltransferase [Myxococcota bacterium]